LAAGLTLVLTLGLLPSTFNASTLELQAQQRQDVWFQSSNVLSRQLALEDTTLRPRQAERKYEDTIYELHGELVWPQHSVEFNGKSNRESNGLTTLDENTQLHPAIVFLVGSGPNSTHTGLYAHFVRENLEQLFLQHGIALLYFDKRGVGLSEGRWHRTDLYERADDARSAVQFLRQQPGIDPDRIGVVGHSQGGTVAQILGHLYGDSLAFIASLAAPTYDTQRRLTHEYYNMYHCSGEPQDIALDKAQKKAISDLNWVNAFPLTKTWRHLSELSDFNPAPHLAQLQLPAYFAFPELDYFVSAEWGVEGLEEATKQTDFTPNSKRKSAPNLDPKAASNTSRPTIQVFPGLDHDFKPTTDVCTGAVTESEQSDELSPKKPAYSQEFQQNFQQWVLSHLGLGVL
jgi:pimeloyl-ACP methyl ester carboxylesterase